MLASFQMDNMSLQTTSYSIELLALALMKLLHILSKRILWDTCIYNLHELALQAFNNLVVACTCVRLT